MMRFEDFYSRDTHGMADVSATALRVGRIVAAWLAHRPAGASKRTHKTLANAIRNSGDEHSPSADSVRQFLAALRKLDRGDAARINRENGTLRSIYNFIIREYHRWPEEIQKVYHRNLLGPRRAEAEPVAPEEVDPELRDVALGALAWLTISGPKPIHELGKKVGGSHYVIRRSPRKEQDFILSLLEIVPRGEDTKCYLEVAHLHMQRSLQQTRSHGFAVPMLRNIYAALRVEGHDGLELLTLRDESQANPRFFKGFMIGLDSDRMLYDSAVLVIPKRSAKAGELELWERLSQKIDRRFTEDDADFVALKKAPDLARAFLLAFRDDARSRAALDSSDRD